MSQLNWEGTSYDVPEIEPGQMRDMDGLHDLFRRSLERYVEFARTETGLDLRIGECRRTLERQVWLLAQGRVNGARVRSWTLDSYHRVGLAADLYIDLGGGVADWEPSTWRQLYEDVPPTFFGLTTISKEYVHLEHAHAGQIIHRSADFYVVKT